MKVVPVDNKPSKIWVMMLLNIAVSLALALFIAFDHLSEKAESAREREVLMSRVTLPEIFLATADHSVIQERPPVRMFGYLGEGVEGRYYLTSSREYLSRGQPKFGLTVPLVFPHGRVVDSCLNQLVVVAGYPGYVDLSIGIGEVMSMALATGNGQCHRSDE